MQAKKKKNGFELFEEAFSLLFILFWAFFWYHIDQADLKLTILQPQPPK